MMQEFFEAIILGIVQGLTEFLPVSSSGHLELSKYILGDDALPQDSMLMTVVLHFGTALATVFVFWKDILNLLTKFFSKSSSHEKTFAYQILVSMIPAAIVGLFFEKEIENMFSRNILLVCGMLLLTGVLLFIAGKAKKTGKNLSFSDAIIMGISQAIAITPGISRSGATISTGVMLGLDKTETARFSFLMVVPLIFGKIAKDLLEGDFGSNSLSLYVLAAGFIAAFITGVFACRWMISIVKNSQLKYFAYYCFLVGISGILYVYLQ
jgi:undecaprenyl-diphosphatase